MCEMVADWKDSGMGCIKRGGHGLSPLSVTSAEKSSMWSCARGFVGLWLGAS